MGFFDWQRPNRDSVSALEQPQVYRRISLYPLVKRTIDLAAVIAASPLLLATVGGLALLVKLDGGPAFYAQKRLGLGGQTYTMWKLRSMVQDADAALAKLLESDAAARQEWDSTQKLRNDPRITPVGKFIRKYSLDELPQLWNVFVGDMSLVGPRPMFPEQRVLYPGSACFAFRPGLTGLWQVSERNKSTFAERASYDNEYARKVSLFTDIAILARTVGVVLRGTGW